MSLENMALSSKKDTLQGYGNSFCTLSFSLRFFDNFSELSEQRHYQTSAKPLRVLSRVCCSLGNHHNALEAEGEKGTGMEKVDGDAARNDLRGIEKVEFLLEKQNMALLLVTPLSQDTRFYVKETVF